MSEDRLPAPTMPCSFEEGSEPRCQVPALLPPPPCETVMSDRRWSSRGFLEGWVGFVLWSVHPQSCPKIPPRGVPVAGWFEAATRRPFWVKLASVLREKEEGATLTCPPALASSRTCLQKSPPPRNVFTLPPRRPTSAKSHQRAPGFQQPPNPPPPPPPPGLAVLWGPPSEPPSAVLQASYETSPLPPPPPPVCKL